MASFPNSVFSMVLIFSPGSTISPGMAHSPQSFLLMATNCRTFLLETEWIIFFPLLLFYHLVKMRSSAWLGPHHPRSPLPTSPGQPAGFLCLPFFTSYKPFWLFLSTCPPSSLNLEEKFLSPTRGSAHMGQAKTELAVHSTGLYSGHSACQLTFLSGTWLPSTLEPGYGEVLAFLWGFSAAAFDLTWWSLEETHLRKAGSNQRRCWGSCWACRPERPRSRTETPWLTTLPGVPCCAAGGGFGGAQGCKTTCGTHCERGSCGWGGHTPPPQPCKPFHFTLKGFDIWKGFQMPSAGVENIPQTPPTKLAPNNSKSVFVLTEVLAIRSRFSSLGPESQFGRGKNEWSRGGRWGSWRMGRGGTQNALFGMIKTLVSATSQEEESSFGTQNMVLVGNPCCTRYGRWFESWVHHLLTKWCGQIASSFFSKKYWLQHARSCVKHRRFYWGLDLMTSALKGFQW